jgi:hypothetical protein
MMAFIGSYIVHRFLRRLDAPFLSMMFEDKFITLPQLKMYTAIGICGYSSYTSVNDILS